MTLVLCAANVINVYLMVGVSNPDVPLRAVELLDSEVEDRAHYVVRGTGWVNRKM